MAYDTATRNKLRAKYVQGMALTSAAEAVGVPYATCRTWKRQASEAGDDWDVARNARRMTKDGVAEMANQVMHEIAEQFLATIEAIKADKKMGAEARAKILVQLMDAYNKAIHATGKATPHANRLAVAMDVVRFLTQRMHGTARAEFLAVVEGLGDALVKEFGASS
jgi:transposase